VVLERAPGALILVASYVKLILGVNLRRACRPVPLVPGCPRLALCCLEIGGGEVPLLSVEALLWRQHSRSRPRGQGERLLPAS
jgi:hypothetical protein